MPAFRQAIADYRDVLKHAAQESVSEAERFIYQVLAMDLEHVDQLYARTGQRGRCRPSIDSLALLHQSEVLRGESVPALRAAFDRLVRAVSQ